MPDALIIQDTTLLQQTDVFAGLADDGYIVINSTRDVPELGIGEMLAAVTPPGSSPFRRLESRCSTLGRPCRIWCCSGVRSAHRPVGLVDAQAAAGERFQGRFEGNCAGGAPGLRRWEAHAGEGVDAMAAVSAGHRSSMRKLTRMRKQIEGSAVAARRSPWHDRRSSARTRSHRRPTS